MLSILLFKAYVLKNMSFNSVTVFGKNILVAVPWTNRLKEFFLCVRISKLIFSVHEQNRIQLSSSPRELLTRGKLTSATHHAMKNFLKNETIGKGCVETYWIFLPTLQHHQPDNFR